jgi:hypothetical protein
MIPLGGGALGVVGVRVTDVDETPVLIVQLASGSHRSRAHGTGCQSRSRAKPGIVATRWR